MEEGEISLEVEGSETPREQNEKMDEDIRVEGTKRWEKWDCGVREG